MRRTPAHTAALSPVPHTEELNSRKEVTTSKGEPRPAAAKKRVGWVSSITTLAENPRRFGRRLAAPGNRTARLVGAKVAMIGLPDNNPRAAVDIHEMELLLGVSRAMVYKLIAKNEIPKPLKLGKKSVWLKSAVMDALRRKHERAQR